MNFVIKIITSALLIAVSSEFAKRSTVVGAIVVSLPLTSLLALVWLYQDTKDTAKIINFSYGIFWAVLPSLLFFIALPVLLKAGLKFWLAMVVASVMMVVAYSVYVALLAKFGVKL